MDKYCIGSALMMLWIQKSQMQRNTGDGYLENYQVRADML